MQDESRKRGLLRLKHAREFNEATAETMAEHGERFSRLADPSSAPAVVSAHQLFPTPPELAAMMVGSLRLDRPGLRVLEPSAGTARLIEALPFGVDVVAVEIDAMMAWRLSEVRCAANLYATMDADFLSLTTQHIGYFDRVIMNPPFTRGADIEHIRHAMTFLKTGGRLVALCMDGARQNASLRPQIEATGGTWESLPADSFKSEGTRVHVALIVLG